MESEQELAERVVGPVVQAVSELGLEVDDPEVLRVGANVVLRLSPSPVVARVATLTAEMRGDPAGYLRREREVTAALVRYGIDVVAPTDLVDPGPHRAGDFWFVLMAHRRLTPVDLSSVDHANAVGHALADLELALAALPAELGAVGRGQPSPRSAGSGWIRGASPWSGTTSSESSTPCCGTCSTPCAISGCRRRRGSG